MEYIVQLYFEFVVGQCNYCDIFGLDNSAVTKYFAVMTQSKFVVETCNTKEGSIFQ